MLIQAAKAGASLLRWLGPAARVGHGGRADVLLPGWSPAAGELLFQLLQHLVVICRPRTD